MHISPHAGLEASELPLKVARNQNFPREARGLLAAKVRSGVANAFVLTLDQADAGVFEGEKIEAVPAWRWLA
ncbi:MAG: hypothetical protein LBT53_07220 [Puniceicoccales bacterium]|jgi:hypothetical protein|nr:hypothetical protein [Puniceicoccales bacterium]